MHLARFAVVLFAFTTAAALSFGARAKEFSTLKEMMEPKDYAAAGLEKLSDAERAALDAWLRSFTGVVEKKIHARVTDEVKAEVSKTLPAGTELVIESRILGRFTGWEGRTIFTLENGQVWRQRDSSVAYKPVNDPAVRIEKSGIGYRMSVDGFSTTVGVTRVK